MPIAKPKSKTTHELGIIAGKFSISLGSYASGLHPEDSKQLLAVLHIESDNAWFVRFEVRRFDAVESFSSLSSAVRAYNAIESEGAKP